MTDHTITGIGDAWVNNDLARRGQNYGGTDDVRLQSTEKRGYLRPELPPLTGRTVLDAYLVGRPAEAVAAQTLTVTPATERFQPGRVTWDNQPTVDNTASVAATVSATAAGGVVTIPGLGLMLQAVADGTPWWGFRLSTTAATTQRFVATDSGNPAWELHIVVSDLTDAPVGLRPAGGLAVPTAATVLSWEATDQIARRVQVDTPALGAEPDWVTPDFDTGLDVTPLMELDLAAEGHTPSTTATKATYWRVLAPAEGDDTDPQWSDPASYTVVPQHTLVVDSPTGPFGDPTPTVAAHITGGTLSHWKAFVTGPDRADVRHTVSLSTGPVTFTIPAKSGGRSVLVDDEGGWVNLRTWDTTDRAVAVGSPDYAEAWVPLTFDVDLGVQAPSALTVHQLDPGVDPRHTWRWSRTEAADAWKVTVDGRTIARLDPEDVTDLGSGFYEWTDAGQIPPLREHVLGVAAIEGDAASTPVTRTQTHTIDAAWIIPPTGEPFQVYGHAIAGFVHTSRRATYETQEGPPVDIIYDPNPGRVGAWEGFVSTIRGLTPAQVYATVDGLEALRKTPHAVVGFVWGAQSISARLIDPDATSADNIDALNLRHVVRFSFVQEGP